MTRVRRQIAQNARAHDRVSSHYEATHGEIFNSTEQQRLREALRAATAELAAHRPLRALDFGCGTGNLTMHLLELGFDVTAADVSPRCLQFVVDRYGRAGRVNPMRLNGEDLREVADGEFDLVAAYSVLHHIPDYLRAVEEMIRVLRPGGILFLDHEAAETYWNPTPEYLAFRMAALPPQPLTWRRFLQPAYYVRQVRRLLNPRYQPEGDIHVWPDDHIEWGRIEAVCRRCSVDVIVRNDYLVCRREYDQAVYDAYREQCADMRLLIARKAMQAG